MITLMTSPISKIKRYSDVLIKLLPLFAFVVPLALLYFLNPSDPYLQVSAQNSFQLMWKGRTFQLFFVWLISLQFILGWDSVKLRANVLNKTKLPLVALFLSLPTIYIILEYYLGLNGAIANSAFQSGITFFDSMPLAVEYLVFSLLFCSITLLYFGRKGLTSFALPGLFVCLVGVLYTIDNVFPYGQFTPFQLLVPTTAFLASKVLGVMGYTTLLGTEAGMPTLQAAGPLGSAKFAIAWPCAGIESLLIFTAVALLFLQQMPISWKSKAGYFVFGAAITYFINVLRIATIFTIGAQFGVNSNQVQMFHFYYGPLYSIAWIVSYPLIILVSQSLWHRRKINSSPMKLQPAQLSPA
jgi:thaumarchaeosortase